MKILIATDIHCGYGENKKYLYEDSFESFEEVLQQAQRQGADLVLLGGDLFHENLPSRDSQLRVMRLIRQYCLNGPATRLRIVSAGNQTFSHAHFKHANFEDQNYTVSLPIFTIHGNHDDLSGKGQTALDLLHEAGLVNLFGKFDSIKKFEVNPILLEKENADGTVSKVALYGISSQRDDRLARAFQDGNVVFNTPPDVDSWQNILVLHQNRPRRSMLRSTGAFIPTELLPGFVDLVLWGHEHLSVPELEHVRSDLNGQDFFILQPGSTVATSLCPDEAEPKHCFLLDSTRGLREPCVQPIRLLTPRQLFYEELNLDELCLAPPSENVRLRENMTDEEYLHRRVEEILQTAAASRNEHQPELPLVRLKVVYSGVWKNVPPVNPRKFGAAFLDRVANPLEMIMPKTCRPSAQSAQPGALHADPETTVNVEELVKDYFRRARGDSQLAIMQPDSLNRALQEYAEVTASFAQVDKRFQQALKQQINAFAAKLAELTADAEDTNKGDFERRLNDCVYAHFAQDPVDKENNSQAKADDSTADTDMLDLSKP